MEAKARQSHAAPVGDVANNDRCATCKITLPGNGENAKLKCSTCKKCYHLFCLNIEEDMTVNAGFRSFWECPSCLRDDIRRKEECKRPFKTIAKLHSPASAISSTVVQLRAPEAKPNVATSSDDAKNKKSCVKPENEHSGEFADAELINIRLSAAETRVRLLQRENANLQKKLYIMRGIIDFPDSQPNCHNTVEILGVPERSDENLVSMITSLFATVGMPVTDDEVRICSRLSQPASSQPRPPRVSSRSILLCLPTLDHRSTLLTAVREYNSAHRNDPLNTENLGVPGCKMPVEVEDHICPNVKELLAATIIAARGKNYQYVWANTCNVFVRKDNNSPTIHIVSKVSLANLT